MAEVEVRKITTYAKRQSAINRATKKQKELHDEILNELMMGSTLPDSGPYLLELGQCGGKDFSWESQYRILLVRVLKKKYGLKKSLEMAEEKMKKLVADAPEKDSVFVLGVNKSFVGGVKFLPPKANPNYRTVRKVA